MSNLICKVPGGRLVATLSSDPDYPGIDVEFIADDDNGENLSRPRVLIECPDLVDDSCCEKTLRALIWNDPNNEDCTEEVHLCNLPSQ